MNKKIELIANISLIIIGLLLGVMSYIKDCKDISAIFLGISIGCILYQFLGGISSENSVQLGVIKFGGSAAVVLGFIFFINNYIFIAEEQVIPDTLIPLDAKTGEIIELSIISGKDTLTYPFDHMKAEFLAKQQKKEYYLTRDEEKYCINADNHIIGCVDIDHSKANLFSSIGNCSGNDYTGIDVFYLYPDSADASSSTLLGYDYPFNIQYHDNLQFSIGKWVSRREVAKRTSYVIPDGDCIYVIYLEQCDHRDQVKKYSKWLVQKFECTWQ